MPRPHPPWRSALAGAAVAAVLFEAAKNGFAFYAAHLGGFDKYSAAGETPGGLGGVCGLLLAFVFWIYFSGLILIAGAVVTGLHECRKKPSSARPHVAHRVRRPDETPGGEAPEPPPVVPDLHKAGAPTAPSPPPAP